MPLSVGYTSKPDRQCHNTRYVSNEPVLPLFSFSVRDAVRFFITALPLSSHYLLRRRRSKLDFDSDVEKNQLYFAYQPRWKRSNTFVRVYRGTVQQIPNSGGFYAVIKTPSSPISMSLFVAVLASELYTAMGYPESWRTPINGEMASSAAVNS